MGTVTCGTFSQKYDKLFEIYPICGTNNKILTDETFSTEPAKSSTFNNSLWYVDNISDKARRKPFNKSNNHPIIIMFFFQSFKYFTKETTINNYGNDGLEINSHGCKCYIKSKWAQHRIITCDISSTVNVHVVLCLRGISRAKIIQLPRQGRYLLRIFMLD